MIRKRQEKHPIFAIIIIPLSLPHLVIIVVVALIGALSVVRVWSSSYILGL